jgi:hypothetical protein
MQFYNNIKSEYYKLDEEVQYLKKIDDDIIWPDFKMRCLKYTPFIRYDKEKYLHILKKRIREYA